jgi:signal peptidase I
LSSFYKTRPFQLLVLAIGAVSLLIAIPIVTGIIRPFTMPSNSMAPTIKSNQPMTLERITYWTRDPERGEIVAHLSNGLDGMPANQMFIKRVIGLPNEHLILSNGTLLINGHPITLTNQYGPLTFPNPPGDLGLITNLTLRPNEYFLIGDNSSNSYDSRLHGPVLRSKIIGLCTP